MSIAKDFRKVFEGFIDLLEGQNKEGVGTFFMREHGQSIRSIHCVKKTLPEEMKSKLYIKTVLDLGTVRSETGDSLPIKDEAHAFSIKFSKRADAVSDKYSIELLFRSEEFKTVEQIKLTPAEAVDSPFFGQILKQMDFLTGLYSGDMQKKTTLEEYLKQNAYKGWIDDEYGAIINPFMEKFGEYMKGGDYETLKAETAGLCQQLADFLYDPNDPKVRTVEEMFSRCFHVTLAHCLRVNSVYDCEVMPYHKYGIISNEKLENHYKGKVPKFDVLVADLREMALPKDTSMFNQYRGLEKKFGKFVKPYRMSISKRMNRNQKPIVLGKHTRRNMKHPRKAIQGAVNANRKEMR